MLTSSQQEEQALTEAEIERTRQRLVESVSALRAEVRRMTDWRQRIRQRPLRAVAVAFSLGFVLGIR